MARAEADMGVTPGGSPNPEPPYAVAPMGSAAIDDDDEEAQMLQGRASTFEPLFPALHESSLAVSYHTFACSPLHQGSKENAKHVR